MNISFEEYVSRCGELGFAWPDRTSLTILFKEVPTYQREWQALLRDVYGNRVLLLGYRLCGRQLPLALLPLIARQEDALTARLTECPSLGPLLVPFLQVDAPVPRDYAVIRGPAIEKGLTPAGWRWLTRQSADVVRKLLRFGWTDEAIRWMNLLAKARPHDALSPRWIEAGRPYGCQGFIQQMALWSPSAHSKGVQLLERYFRLLPTEASSAQLVEHEMVLAEVFRTLVEKDFNLIKPQQSWLGLVRKVRGRHASRMELARQRAGVRKASALSWEPKLGSITLSSIQVTELCDEAALLSEGISMSHCVGDGGYSNACVEGQHVIFSLAHDSTGCRATLQLVRARHNGWTIGQLAGPANGKVPSVFWNCAKSVRDLLAAA